MTALDEVPNVYCSSSIQWELMEGKHIIMLKVSDLKDIHHFIEDEKKYFLTALATSFMRRLQTLADFVYKKAETDSVSAFLFLDIGFYNCCKKFFRQ